MKPVTHDIVVTGLAAISAAGVGLETLAAAISDGQSRLRPVPEDLAGGGHLWGPADGFRAADFMPPLKARKFDRCSLMAVAAAGMALRDAVLDLKGVDPTRVGIVLGCGFGGIANSVEFLSGYFTGGVDGLSPMLFPNTVANAAASNASIEHGIQGPNVTFVQRFCSAETALTMGCRFLEEGRADVIIAGGVDELNAMMIRGFDAMKQLGSYAGGFGEGCGLLVLERRDHAERRRAPVRGRIAGIRSVGLILPGAEDEGVARLLPENLSQYRISVSGTADLSPRLMERLPGAPQLQLHRLTGRSLAMGGLALAALLLTLREGEQGLHLAASPEGPFVAIEISGGAPV
ncbi:Beta-ketoacyl synthase [Geobacter metallireducens RCH3]|uniref:3-oxoacyl-(Acyl carrier protein) synthase-related protein n=1 Tax=Geobacter metallireducens (strain ATCC 53774 / DSM 7210 / GS-15) TaxID=269799 RepID=Q39UZ7_GEOMG|nr:beta-ketoacyl synthase N-terminal-like domain-containing protein [Geobacter metallireducens]ABB31927.1 3-oxoacyl-(acyl carrier protein) synthase-related protein [Geobacter metallireducens GS-15]EHP84971.1 Beta-ketoacyl synthase [Geobacter metallireducens RCH3]